MQKNWKKKSEPDGANGMHINGILRSRLYNKIEIIILKNKNCST